MRQFRAAAAERTAPYQWAACESPKRSTVDAAWGFTITHARGTVTARAAWHPLRYVAGSSCAAARYDGTGFQTLPRTDGTDAAAGTAGADASDAATEPAEPEVASDDVPWLMAVSSTIAATSAFRSGRTGVMTPD